jgi:Protein kinase domain
LFHLDLKPSNILLDGDADAPWNAVTPRVSDFGLAVSDGYRDVSETSLACPRGTPSYMSPEQASANRAQIGAASDIHALGAILYELLTGRPPFQGASTPETLDQVRGQNPVSPRRLNAKIPRDVETIALKCLEKNPSRRYQSAESLAGDLRRWLDVKPISARPVSPIEHAWRWCRRRPVGAALVATLTMTFSAGFLTVVLLWRRAEVERNRAEREWSHAERERSRAQAGYRAARAALAQVVGLGIEGLQTRELSSDVFIAHLHAARGGILELAKSQSHDPETWKLLALTNLVIGRTLDRQGKPVEGRPFHVEAILNWDEILHRDPNNPFAQHHRWESLVPLARLSERQGSAEESVRQWERTISWGEETILPSVNDRELVDIAECRISLARLLDHSSSRVHEEGPFRRPPTRHDPARRLPFDKDDGAMARTISAC